nr:hypothetical protein [Tanacetum cinerariifolium]
MTLPNMQLNSKFVNSMLPKWGGQENAFDDDVDEPPVQDLALTMDRTFQADQSRPSYDLDILSEVQDHDDYTDNVAEFHEYVKDNTKQVVKSNVSSVLNDTLMMISNDMHEQAPQCVSTNEQSKVVNASLTAELASYKEQYVKDNTKQVVKSNVSSVLNDALMMISNDMHEHAAQCVSTNEQSKVVNASLTAELASYKEQVELYERWAKFELTESEQKMDEQLRIFITYRNFKEESLKKELHSIKMQLNSTIGHNKSSLFK